MQSRQCGPGVIYVWSSKHATLATAPPRPIFPPMPKRTSPRDAARIVDADDLDDIVQDKRAGWRATGAKARRRQRRYQNLLTQQLRKGIDPEDEA